MSIADAFVAGPTARRIDAGNLAMHVVETGKGRPLVFLHGLGWDHRLWLASLDRYGDRYRAIAGDTRGHGQSAAPPGPYSIAQFADDWRAALDALGVETCCLVCLSQGGMVAQQLAIAAPDRVAALVLVSTACRESEDSAANMAARLEAMRAAGPAAGAEAAAQSIFSAGFRNAEPDYLAAFLAERAAQPQEPLIAAMAAISGFDVRPGLAGLAVPTLVIAGSEDALTRPATVREVADAIPGAVYAELPGACHIIPVEQPLPFHAALDAFLPEHYPPA